MALLKDLFSEAVDRSQAVTQDAVNAEIAVAAIGKRAEQLAEEVESRGQQVRDRSRSLAEELEHAQQELKAVLADARGRLDHSRERAAELEALAEAFLAKLEKEASDLQATRASIATGLEEEAEATRAAMAELSSRQEAFGRNVDVRLNQAIASSTSLAQDAAELRAAVPAAWQELNGALEDLEEGAAAQMEALAEAFEDSMAREAGLLSDLAEKLVEEHNRIVAVFVGRMTEESFAQLAEAMEPLRSAVDDLQSACETSDGLLAERFAFVTAKLSEIATLLGRIKPALELTSQIEPSELVGRA